MILRLAFKYTLSSRSLKIGAISNYLGDGQINCSTNCDCCHFESKHEGHIPLGAMQVVSQRTTDICLCMKKRTYNWEFLWGHLQSVLKTLSLKPIPAPSLFHFQSWICEFEFRYLISILWDCRLFFWFCSLLFWYLVYSATLQHFGGKITWTEMSLRRSRWELQNNMLKKMSNRHVALDHAKHEDHGSNKIYESEKWSIKGVSWHRCPVIYLIFHKMVPKC